MFLSPSNFPLALLRMAAAEKGPNTMTCPRVQREEDQLE